MSERYGTGLGGGKHLRISTKTEKSIQPFLKERKMIKALKEKCKELNIDNTVLSEFVYDLIDTGESFDKTYQTFEKEGIEKAMRLFLTPLNLKVYEDFIRDSKREDR